MKHRKTLTAIVAACLLASPACSKFDSPMRTHINSTEYHRTIVGLAKESETALHGKDYGIVGRMLFVRMPKLADALAKYGLDLSHLYKMDLAIGDSIVISYADPATTQPVSLQQSIAWDGTIDLPWHQRITAHGRTISDVDADIERIAGIPVMVTQPPNVLPYGVLQPSLTFREGGLYIAEHGGQRVTGTFSAPVYLTQLMSMTGIGQNAKTVSVIINDGFSGEFDSIIVVGSAQYAVLGLGGNDMQLGKRMIVATAESDPWKDLKSFVAETKELVTGARDNTGGAAGIKQDIRVFQHSDDYMLNKEPYNLNPLQKAGARLGELNTILNQTQDLTTPNTTP